jgi:DNA-directed RNA polymerase specialized sigma24 family protein
MDKRSVLLRVYRGWGRPEDIEDCYSQATLEILARARRDGGFRTPAHIANALEQKLCSRIHDRRRALAGRSAAEAAFASALPLADGDCGGVDVPDPRARTEEIVAARLQFREILALGRRLTRDQRLVLVCQLQLGADSRELCTRLGWSPEKYRKVAQRGRVRLQRLAEQEAARPVATSASERTLGRTYELASRS